MYSTVATLQRQDEGGARPGAGSVAHEGAGFQPILGADAQALTRKLSEAALGLSSGKELHKFLPPDGLLPSPLKGDAAAPEPSCLSGGRNGILRPQARRQGPTSSGPKHQASPYDKQALVAALSWQHASLSDKNVEGSATSDEDHPRLVPRRGAGPELRSSGREIDEYLMRLLHAGSTDGSHNVEFHNLTPPATGDAAANVDTPVAFPAGWNNTKPWFVGSGASSDSAQAQAAVQANPVKPMMPPPAFPSQPWQGSRLGPLPPVGPLAQCPMTAQQANKLAGKVVGESSVLAAGSEGTMDTVTLPAASCPAAIPQAPLRQDAPANSPLHRDLPPSQQQQQQQQQQQGAPSGMEQPEKKQKTESSRPPEKVSEVDLQQQQQHAVSDAVLPKAASVNKTGTPAEAVPGGCKPIPASGERIARVMVGRVGKVGMDVIRDTMMCQQALWTEQVEDLHRIVTRQNVLMRLVGLHTEEQQQAQAVKKENASGDAAADPRTVLVSHVGNGSGGSHPSTDQGSWPQVQSDTGRDASLPSGMLPSAQQGQHAQQAQSVRHPVNQAMAQGHNIALGHVVYPQAQTGQRAAAQQAAQHTQQALQQEQAAAQELMALSGQGSRDPMPRLGQGHWFNQSGQEGCQEAMGLSPSFRAGSGQLDGTPQTPTGLSPTFMAAQVRQLGRAGSGLFGRVGSGQLQHADPGPFMGTATDPLMRATSGQLMQGFRALSGQLSGQLEEPIGNLGRAGSAAATFMDAQAPDFQMQNSMAAQLQQRSRSYPLPQAMHPQGMTPAVAAQQQQQQQSAAEWYAEFLHHMSVQQPPPNMLQHPAMWPWSYHYAQSQLAAQAMSAAAMSLQGDARMMWQNPGAQTPRFGLRQAMAAQAAQQQQLQQQEATFQGKCNMSNATPPAGASEDVASQESARESHEHPDKSPGAPADAPEGAAAIAKTCRADEATSSLSSLSSKKRPRDT